MRLQFKTQQHQTESVDARIDVYAGQPAMTALANALIALSQPAGASNVHCVQDSRGWPIYQTHSAAARRAAPMRVRVITYTIDDG